MKNIIKLLIPLGFVLFNNLDSKAQVSDSGNFNFERCVSSIPYSPIAPEFKDYQKNNPDTIRAYHYQDRVNKDIFYQHVHLNFDEDFYPEVVETNVGRENENGEFVNKYEHPWGYAFYPGQQGMYYSEVREIGHEPDGPNENERSLEKLGECFDRYKESALSRE